MILYTKVEILNSKFQLISELTGRILGSPSFSNNSTSDIRRTCSLSFYPSDVSLNVYENSKLWIDKLVKVYVGVSENEDKSHIKYTNMGVYLINNPSQSYDSANNTINISGIDLMAKMTSLRGGNLEGIDYLIPQGTNVRELLIDTLEMYDFHDFVITEYPIVTPYDITITVGGTGYDIIKEILNILPNYQAYFDVNGVFHFEEIPNGVNEQIMINDDIWSKVLISHQRDYDYENVKNYVEVLGKIQETDNYCTDVVLSGKVISMNCASVTELSNNTLFAFSMTNSDVTNPSININSYGNKSLYEDGKNDVTLKANTYYVIKYISDLDYFKLLSSYQPYAISKEDNPQSPFYYQGGSGLLRIVLSGGDYDNINSDYLAKQRADFELYQRCRLQDSVSIVCVPIYDLDTNWLVEITLPNKQGIEKKEKYLIKSINTNLGKNGTQTISMMKYYPYYPSI